MDLAALRKTADCWDIIIKARNLIVHTIPININPQENLWWFEKKFRIPKTKTFRSRTEELQPEHIYSFGQEIYRFTLELVTIFPRRQEIFRRG